MGHNVTSADRDEHQVRSILDGKALFYEPGLQELVQKNVAAGRLSATTSTPDAIKGSDVVLKNENLRLDELRRACVYDLPKHAAVAFICRSFPF